METLGAAVAASLEEGRDAAVPGYFVPALAVRNLLFLIVVLAHGFRRMFPPY